MAPRVCSTSSSHAFWAIMIPRSAKRTQPTPAPVSRRHPLSTVAAQIEKKSMALSTRHWPRSSLKGWGGGTLTQKAALLSIQTRSLPNSAPGPLGDELLPRPRERSCVLHSIVDVLVAEDSTANLQSLLEELAVQLGEFWVCAGHGNRYDQKKEMHNRGKVKRVESGSDCGLEVKVKVRDG